MFKKVFSFVPKTVFGIVVTGTGVLVHNNTLIVTGVIITASGLGIKITRVKKAKSLKSDVVFEHEKNIINKLKGA